MSTTATIKWVRYNSDLNGDNGWYNAAGNVWSGYGRWADGSGFEHYGPCNWKSVVCIQVPAEIGSLSYANELVVALKPNQSSYPYKSCAVLTRGNAAPLVPNKVSTKRSKMDVGPSDALRAISLGQSFAYTSSDGKTERTYSGGKDTLYYVFKDVQLIPGELYYVYFMRESVKHSDDSHGTSGWISGNIVKDESTLKESPREFRFNLLAKLNNKSTAVFPVGASIDVDGVTCTGAYSKNVQSGSTVVLSNLVLPNGFVCDLGKTAYVMDRDITVTLDMYSKWTIRYVTSAAEVENEYLYKNTINGEITLYSPSAFRTPLKYDDGITPTGWSINGMTYKMGSKLNLLKFSSGKTLNAYLVGSNNSYNIQYKLNGEVVHEERFNYNSPIELKTLNWIKSRFPEYVKAEHPTGWDVLYKGKTYLYDLGELISNAPFARNVVAALSSTKVVYELEVGDKYYDLYYGEALPVPTNIPIGKAFRGYVIRDTNIEATWDNIYENSVEDGDGNRLVSLSPVFTNMYKPVVYQGVEIVSLTPVVISGNSYEKVIPYIYKGDN